MPGREKLIEEARSLDAGDALRRFREEFYLPEGIYLDGNSLGPLSRRAEERLLQTIAEWKALGIDGWMEAEPAWYYLAESLGALLAPLLGAAADEVIVANSTTVNLHQILATFYRPAGRRTKIVVDEYAFPTDVYAVKSHLALHGLDAEENLLVVESRERLIEEDDVVALMDSSEGEVAMLVVPGVVYTTGQLLDIARLTREAHDRGILICIDAAHSIGSVPHQFDAWDVDFAVWCNYKHLNAGPGAVGGLYVNRRHFGARPGLAGWFSSDKDRQFDMAHEPTFAGNAGAYQMGTNQILSMAPLQASLEMFQEAGIEAIREKSLGMTRFLVAWVERELSDSGIGIATPRDDVRRGGHVALVHPEGARINAALKRHGIVPDFRPPDMIRLAPVALYNSYEEVAQTVLALKRIMERQEYLEFPNVRGVVA